MTPSQASWAALISRALTGVTPALHGDITSVEQLLAALEGEGFDSKRVAELAAAAAESGEVWPFPIDPRELREAGPARVHAALREAQRLLGLDGLSSAAPSTRKTLNADELRLLREVPPHHGA